MADKQIKKRDFAKLCNLQKAKHYNDQVVQIVEFIEETKRWQVEVLSSSKYLAVKPENLQILSDYNPDIVDQLVAFHLGTKLDILEAMHFVIDKKDINMIAEYLASNPLKADDYLNDFIIPMTIRQKVELVVEGFINAIFGYDLDFVYPDISRICMLYLSNIFSKSQYILIQNNANPIIYGTSLTVISESETEQIHKFRGDYIMNCIAAQHPKMKTSQLIGFSKGHSRLYTKDTTDEIELENSFFIHRLDNISKSKRYIPIQFTSESGGFFGDPIGYSMIMAFDKSMDKITNRVLYDEIYSAISHIFKSDKQNEDDYKLNAVCKNKNFDPYADRRNSNYRIPKRIFEIKKNHQIFTIDLEELLTINVGVQTKSCIKDSFRYFNVFNCKRDAITAPVQEFREVRYGLTGNPNDTVYVDKTIDVNMTVGNFRNYVAQKHSKWLTDEDNQNIVLTDHANIADHEPLSAVGNEPLRLHVGQRDNCLIQ